jgi:hypothetical protein
MFATLAQALKNRFWGTKFKADGKNIDTGVSELAQELATQFEALSETPIEVTRPIVINNRSGGPAFIVNNYGGDARAIQFNLPDGTNSSFGVGLGNQGIVANEMIPLLQYVIDMNVVNVQQSFGNGGGGVTEVPGEGVTQSNPKNTGYNGGPGPLLPNLPPETGVGGGGVGSGLKPITGGPCPLPEQEAGTGGGLGSGGQFPGEGGLAGGGNPRRTGPDWGWGQDTYGKTIEVRPPITQVYHSFRPIDTDVWSFRWGNQTFYIPTFTLSGGITGSKTVVTAVSCSGGTLTVTTETVTITKGLITAWA